ncbi:MAG: GH92 family glycosyl hydrolase [Granulicella sp.]
MTTRCRFAPVLYASLSAALALSLAAAAQTRPADLVNPLDGTANEGQTFPAAGVPFAMTQWTPATREGQRKSLVPYYYEDSQFRGFRGSHFLSGSATQDYGSVQILMGQGTPELVTAAPSLPFSHADEHSTPYLYTVSLLSVGIQASITGTARCGILRLQFAHGGRTWIAVENFARAGEGSVSVDPTTRSLTSQSAVRRLYAGSGQPAGFSGYAVVELDRRFDPGPTWSARPVVYEDPNKSHHGYGVGGPPQHIVPETSTGASIVFNATPGEVVYLRIGTSFTSVAEARQNLRAEIPTWNFDQIAHQAESDWNRLLGKIQIKAPVTDERVFYTSMYHAMLLPRIASDVSGTHPRFGGGGIVTTPGHTYYDDYSIWDTFRAVHPLFILLDPPLENDLVQSLIDKGEEGGWLPIFPAWGSYTAEMDGDHGDAIIGDAWLKGMRGFDIHKAYALMRKNALVSPSRAEYADGKGRRALQSYLTYGYIPLEDPIAEAPHRAEQVSRTLDYSLDDFVLGQVAHSLGKAADAAMFDKRGQNWRNMLDPETGFARGRHADGSWITPFDPAKPAAYVTEGIPFQYTFYVLQDIPGLIQYFHGDRPFVAKLDPLFARGLYEHGNEPSHHIGYLYDYAGAAPKTQFHIHEIVDIYHDAPGGLAGNDDAGQMSAWYIFSALGLYPETPGIPAYAIGTPRFSHAVIHLLSGKNFEIVANNVSKQNFYIQSAVLNGLPLNRFWLKHSEIEAGGTLVFEMGPKPNAAWPKDTTAPKPMYP